MKKVLSTRFLTVPDLLQLKRERIPLELGCATTVHDNHGDTCTSIATSADDQWQHRMWSRQMLFTLLTMVERLCQITFVGFNADNISSLLRLRTHWHADADTWCQKVNLLRSISPAPAHAPPIPDPRPFYDRGVQSLPGAGIRAVYILESTSTKACYPESTDNVFRRLAEHSSRRGAVITAWIQDWSVKACVLGFPHGLLGRTQARAIELKLLHSPVVPHLPLYEWVRLIHLLVPQHNADSVSTLWVQLF